MHVSFQNISIRWRTSGQKKEAWDPCRKRWVVLTPEEWVRQHVLQFLIQEMAYPVEMIAVEKELTIINKRRRFDVLVYDFQHVPWLMIECKEQEVVLDQSVLDQILHYNIGIPVPFLVVTNGHHTMGFERTINGLEWLKSFPLWASKKPPL
jgi:hypothetical protein